MTTPAAPLASQPDPMLDAFASRAKQTAPAPTASPNSASGDSMLDAFTARKVQASQPQAAATQQPEQPGFGQRTYEASGLKGLIETAKQKWQESQASAQEEQKMAESAVEALKSKNYGQAAELILGHLAKHVGLGPGTGMLLDAPGAIKQSVQSSAESIAHHAIKGIQAAHKGEYGTAALEGAGVLGGDDRMIEDIENKNVAGLAGDVAGGGIKAGAMLLGAKGLGGEAAAGEEAAIAKPGFIKQAIKGEKIAQVPARQAMEAGAKASAEDAGVAASATKGKGIRTLLDEPIKSTAKAERAAYDTVNEAAETDMKSLFDRKADLEDALDDPTNIANRQALEKELRVTDKAIKVHSDLAQSKGVVSEDAIKQAEGMTKQRYAMENLKQKLFNNEGIVEGNVAHGAEETINVKAAIREVEKLDKPSRFAPEGSPSRLQQALGEKGATQLKQALYDAQKAGESALTKQRIAKILGGLAGVGGAQGFIRGLMGH